MISKQENRTYFIEKGKLIFLENDLENPNRISVSVSSGTTIQVYDSLLIGFMSDGKFYSWLLKGYSTKLAKNDAYYIYARLSRTGTDALVVFSVNKYNLDGSKQDVEVGVDNPASEEYYFVRIGEVTATDGTTNREVTYDSGMLGTTQDVYENAGAASLNEMFELFKTNDPWYIVVKHMFYDLTIKRALTLMGSLIWGDKELKGVHTSVDVENETAPDDSHVATSGYVNAYGDNKYLRKDQDDRTEHSLSIGSNLTVDKDASVGHDLTVGNDASIKGSGSVLGNWSISGMLSAIKGALFKGVVKFGEFISGLSGGYIDDNGDAELNSLILRDHLSVPEIRYNRITYFEGYNLISPGGGLTIEDYIENEDGTITVTPRLEDGEPCGQFVDDFLLGYWHDKTASGDFAGFMKVQFRVVSVDYDAKTFVMQPRPGQEYKIAKNMILGQTGNLSNTERQTFIVLDTRDGNNNITFYDHVNEFDPTPAHEMAWFGKKKNRTVHDIDASSYSAVLKNIIMSGRIYQVDDITGEEIRVPCDKGEWVSGQQYAYYDRVTYQGSLWLCINKSGTTQMPSSEESSWLEQVKAGKGITSYAHWEASQTPYPASTILNFADRVWISVRETSEPPLGLVTANGAYLKYHDELGNEGYVLRNPETQSEDWVLLIDVSGLKDGESIDVQYSADTVSWHDDFAEGDLYMRQRKGQGQWSGAMRIVGEKGKDGQHTEYEFTKNKSAYTQPTTGWQDAPPSLSEGEYLWMRTGVVIPPKAEPDAWAVVRLSGEKGDKGDKGTDGTNGADGTSITNLGQWSTSLGTVPKMCLVKMGGRSWLSKVATANPPLGTVMVGGGRMTYTASDGTKGYVLSGTENTTEWELMTSDTVSYSLVPTTSSVVQGKTGFLSPSSFLVYARQQCGTASVPYAKNYLVCMGMDYKGVLTRITGPVKAGEVAVTASRYYTQFIVRMYATSTEAGNWTDGFLCECTVGVTADGVDGSTIRPRGRYNASATYVWNDTFRDVVIDGGHTYRVRTYGMSFSGQAPEVGGNDYWEAANEMQFVATDLLLADEVSTDKLTVTKVKATSADGNTTCTIDGDTGKLTAKNAEFEGVTSNNMTATNMKSNNMTATNMTVDGLTAVNADVSGKITATSGQIAGMKISGVGLTNEGFNNDAYIILRNDSQKRFAGIGANVLPVTSGASGLARFENKEIPDTIAYSTNYAMILAAQNAQNNIAINIDGGSVSGFAWKNLLVSASVTLGRYDNNIITINNSADITVTLPTMQLYDDGHVVRIKRLGSYKTYIKTSYCYTYNGSDGTSRYTPAVLVYDAHAKLIPGDRLLVESECDAMELVWVRDINYTINGINYYGAWIQYKIPRAW